MLLLLSISCINTYGQIIANGGFESPPLVNGDPYVFNTGDPGTLGANCGLGAMNLPGWDIGTNMWVVLNRGSGYGASPAEGEQFLTFNPGNRGPGGNISQTIQTMPGLNYTISFDVGSMNSGSGLLLNLSIYNGGESTSPLATGAFAPPSLAGFGSAHFLSFTASSTSTKLLFTDVSNPDNTINQDLLLDGVTVIGVPEPKAHILIFIGMLFFTVCCRRKAVSGTLKKP